MPASILANAFLDVPGMIGEARSRSAANAGAMRTSLTSQAHEAGITLKDRTVRCTSSAIFDRAAEAARVHDLAVIGWGGAHAERIYLAETVVFGSGRPIRVLPPPSPGERREFRRIAVACDGGAQAARALADALPLLRSADEVRLVAVQGEKAIPETDFLDDIGRHLQVHGIMATLDRIDAAGRKIGQALEEHVREHRSDLLVMGAFRHSRLHEIVLGGATQSMLDSPPVPVFLSH